ncbi:MAG: class II aldolase/adducin family protein [Oscillospiraceae bacterium]|nr:class II aldolase/adducin family protein [Oscillospiraceae bacterium]
MYKSSKEAKEAILQAGQCLYQNGYVAANDGNITARMEDGSVWCTPTGVSKGFMTEDMLVRVNPDGRLLEGKNKVSSEILLHLAIYKQNPNLGGIVHAHGPGATAWASFGKPWELAISLDSALHLGTVPCAPFAVTGSSALAEGAAPYSKNHTAVFLEHHGSVTWGEDVRQALFRTEVLEQTFKIYANMRTFGEVRLLSQRQLDEIERIKTKYNIRCPRAKGRDR